MSLALFNQLESLLWFALALILSVQAWRQGRNNRFFKVTVVTALAFLLFGVSDLIEAQTGAWWHPVELLLLKVACVLTLVACYVWYRLLLKSQQSK
ncbi:hypothetical protein [Marinicella meishanensis]|uniref:hypothetical protein n=1 Tax=Marinicella meishanensis TaxID=2873263 RepID=UPI001CBDEFFB|nr:hypothetical protein [Marinicella sp. NBU2979]